MGEKVNKKKHFANKPANQPDSKEDDVEDEDEDGDFGKIVSPEMTTKKGKMSHFERLEHQGLKGHKCKRGRRAKTESPQNVKSNSTNQSSRSVPASPGKINPYSTRGQPLGMGNKRGGALGGGKKYVMGSMLKQKSDKVHKEEEVVGTMRYIYEVDELGNRTLVRRLPVRKISAADSAAHSLK